MQMIAPNCYAAEGRSDASDDQAPVFRELSVQADPSNKRLQPTRAAQRNGEREPARSGRRG